MRFTEGYLCNNCGEFYDWRVDAAECCYQTETAYQCNSCYAVHEDELDADCCCVFEDECHD